MKSETPLIQIILVYIILFVNKLKPIFYYDAERKQRLQLLDAPINKPQIYRQVDYMGEVCLNVVGIWRYGFKLGAIHRSFCSATSFMKSAGKSGPNLLPKG